VELRDRKNRLRLRMAAQRRAVEPVAAQQAARRVASHLAARPELRGAARVVLYAALPDELPTLPLFAAALEAGKPVLLPRVPRAGVLEFAPCARWEELRPGRYGVLEPPARSPAQPLERRDLIVVPGVAFDRAGNRLGRGQGYYDRWLPPPQDGPLLVGAGFAFQLVASVPNGPGDRRMDAILTEQGWHRVADRSGG
jgi:5-formyltetrahydrofolate cyclo-ligase